MVYINLLPIREIKKRAKAIQLLTLYAITLAFVLGALGVFWYYQNNIIKGLNSDIISLEQEKKRYQDILAQIAKLEANKKLIESKIAVIKELQKSKAITVHVLDEIANLTPSKRVWLTSLRHQGFSVHLSGMALDNQTIATYMETLKTSDWITGVNLISTSLAGYAGRDLKTFQLTCSIVLPEQKSAEASVEQKQ